VIHLSERITRARRLRGPDDFSVLVDPDRVGNVHHVEEFGDNMPPIDDAWISRIGRLDPRLGGCVACAIERDRDGKKSLGSEFSVKGLPHGQVEAAASP
jgi:hypothetical protein